jgi:hypothetical protein
VATVGASVQWSKNFLGQIEESMIHRFISEESTIYRRCIQDGLLPAQGRVWVTEFVRHASKQARQMSHDFATARESPDRSRGAVLVLIALCLAPAALTVVATYTNNQTDQPSDAELMENLLAHETKFEELVQMIHSDCRSFPPGTGESIGFAGLSAVVSSAARMEIYKRLLRQTSVADLRYFPGSGKLILLPAAAQTNIEGSSKSHAYMLGGQPQPVVAHHGYNWRGPGVYVLTGDRWVKGFWFIHYDTRITVEFSPY